MRGLKSFILLLASGFLFLGSMGINVFSHVCEEDGTHVSYFFSDDSICGGHEHDSNVQNQSSCDADKACCCDEVPEGNEDKGCCSISTDVLKVDLDFCNKVYVKAFIVDAISAGVVWEIAAVSLLQDGVPSLEAAPPHKVRSLLVDHQQWLI